MPLNETIYATGAQFLLYRRDYKNKVSHCPKDKKVCLLRPLCTPKPGLLILDEPTNHINFRHLPPQAKAVNDFESTIILVSHMPEFVEQIKITDVLDLERVAWGCFGSVA